MARLVVLAALVATVLAATASCSDVVDATDATFKNVIGSAPLVLVEFYAPWCGHCKKLAPEWESAATQISGNPELKGKVVLAKMDATVETTTAQEQGVQGYPTIKFFRDGELAGEYDGRRTAEGIVGWVKSNVGPAVTPVTTKAEFDSIVGNNEVVVANFFVSGDHTTDPVYQSFESIAKQYRAAYKFIVVTDAEVAGENAGKIMVFKHFDNKEDIFEGDARDASEVSKFIQNSAMKLFDEMGPENYKSYVDRRMPIAWLFANPGEDASNAAKEQVSGIASKFKGKILFTWIDAKKYGGMAARIGLKGTKFPALAIDSEEKHYVFNEESEITADAISSFCEEFLEGKLSPSIRSEAEPAEHTVDGLTTVVGTTFDALVKEDTSKHVLVEFYAPWCGHCKKLAPEYKALAKTLKDVDGIRIAQIDATSNDFDRKMFSVQGFPTIILVNKDKSVAPVPYEGDRTAKAILSFLSEKLEGVIPKDTEVAQDEL